MELEEFRETFKTALGKLPPRIAQVFQLYAVEELPNHEVCEQLNISENTGRCCIAGGSSYESTWAFGGSAFNKCCF
jgi:DNA-directed RNA polymerase specialized sigma24 family protein